MKKFLTVMFSLGLAFSLSTPIVAQDAKPNADKEKAPKEDRLEGVVTIVSKGKSTITVRKAGSDIEKTVAYDVNTEWVSQEHGAKKLNKIDASQVKEGDRVICTGRLEKDGIFRAFTINKRLTPR